MVSLQVKLVSCRMSLKMFVGAESDLRTRMTRRKFILDNVNSEEF